MLRLRADWEKTKFRGQRATASFPIRRRSGELGRICHRAMCDPAYSPFMAVEMTRRVKIRWLLMIGRVLCVSAVSATWLALGRPLSLATENTVTPQIVTPTSAAIPLAYHLATNAVGRTLGFTNPLAAMAYLSKAPPIQFYQFLYSPGYAAIWSTNCWLRGVRGLTATCLGYNCTNHVGYEYMVTMVSPRHYLAQAHVAWAPFFSGRDVVVFSDTNNQVYRRVSLQYTNVQGGIAAGILDSDLPNSVGYVPVLPGNYTNWLSTSSAIQGIGVNQDYLVFGEAIQLGNGVRWDGLTGVPVPFGLGTNWTSCADPFAKCHLRQGDSSDPVQLLIENHLVLLSSSTGVNSGPDYAMSAAAINAAMHYLSTNNGLGTDYQLSFEVLTNWQRLTQ